MVEGITNEEFSKWKKDLKKGLTISQVAKKYNRAYIVIQQRLRKEPSYKRLTTKQREEIKTKYKKGTKIVDLSKEYGVNSASICILLKSLIRNVKNKELNKIKKGLKNLSNFEIGYIVGILEGEGCIYITKEKKRYRPRITIANVDKKMINKLHSLLPFMLIYKTKRQNEKWLPLFTLVLTNKKHIKIFCKVMIPYMISKKEEMKLILKIIENNMDTTIITKLSKIKRKKNTRCKIR